MAGSTSAQSRSAASRITRISSARSSIAGASSNRPAVEPVDPVGPERAALARHHREQARQPRVEAGRVGVEVLHQALHEAARQQPRILGEQAEQHPVEEVRHGRPLDPAVGCPEALREGGELGGRLLGDERAHHVGTQAVRVGEQRPQQAQRLRRALRPGRPG